MPKPGHVPGHALGFLTRNVGTSTSHQPAAQPRRSGSSYDISIYVQGEEILLEGKIIFLQGKKFLLQGKKILVEGKKFLLEGK